MYLQAVVHRPVAVCPEQYYGTFGDDVRGVVRLFFKPAGLLFSCVKFIHISPLLALDCPFSVQTGVKRLSATLRQV